MLIFSKQKMYGHRQEMLNTTEITAAYDYKVTELVDSAN